MKIGIVILVIVLILALIFGSSFVTRRNQMAIKREAVNAAWSQVDVVLQRRADLIPNLVETVKGYAAHERGTLDEVIAARGAAASATTVEGKVAAENALTGALGRLFAVAEAYPDLKANRNFLELQSELTDIENKLAAARRFFNNAVSEFNAAIQTFPAVLFAAALGFTPRDFFDLGADRAAASTPPPVKF